MIFAVCGYGRHGKETVSRYIADVLGLRYIASTSEAAAEVVYNVLKDKYDYPDVTTAWQDRHNHRAEWAQIIWEYNEPDGLTLYREMLKHNDIIDGIRRSSELAAIKQSGLIDVTIWVDAHKRRPPEDPASCEISANDCDVIIDNNGTIAELEQRLDEFLNPYVEKTHVDY